MVLETMREREGRHHKVEGEHRMVGEEDSHLERHIVGEEDSHLREDTVDEGEDSHLVVVEDREFVGEGTVVGSFVEERVLLQEDIEKDSYQGIQTC